MISSRYYLIYFVRIFFVIFDFLKDENILIFVIEDFLKKLKLMKSRSSIILLIFICLMIL